MIKQKSFWAAGIIDNAVIVSSKIILDLRIITL